MCKGGGFPCYAYRLAHTRLKERYLANSKVADITNRLRDANSPLWDKVATDPFYPRFWPERLENLGHPDGYGYQKVTHPKGIFVCDMGELFGDWIPRDWQNKVFEKIREYPEHRFYLLTKQPQNLAKFSPFPENAWVGITATDYYMMFKALNALAYLDGGIQAKVKFISFEPLLESVAGPRLNLASVNWVIIGACTGTRADMATLCEKYPALTLMPWGNRWTAQPQVSWVSEITEACAKAGIPYFLKNNLRPLLGDNLHQEMPSG